MAMRATKKMSEPAKRWTKRAVAFVVTLGSVAGAVTALKALWPEADPLDPQDSATLSIEIVSDVPLTEFTQRQQLTARLLTQPTDEVPDDEIAVTDAPECPIQDDGCTTEQTDVGIEESSEDAPITDESPERARQRPNTGDEGLEHTPPPDVVEWVCQKLGTPCADRNETGEPTSGPSDGAVEGAHHALEGVGAGNTVDQNGNQVAPEIAAQRILRVLRDTRRSASDEPLGAVVNVNAVLAGLRDRPVQLTWSMWQAGGGDRLHGSWLNEHLVYRIVPDTDRDSANVDLWVPLPTSPGPFLVYVYASLDGARLTSDRSEPFG